MSMPEATCTACGSIYRGAALARLDVHEWERRDGVLHQRWWCLCQHDRKGRDAASGSAVAVRADLGANAVLVRCRRYGVTRMSAVVIARGTKTQWTAESGAAYVRHGTDAGKRRGNPDEYMVIPPDELARLETWAAKETR